MTEKATGSSEEDGCPDKRQGRGFGAQVVYEELRRTIVDLTLPPGSPLDEVTLSRRFNMSRTPVREAILRLVADGLVKTLPNRNLVVAPIDFEQLPVYFEALTLMYRATTRGAAVYAKASDLVLIRKLEAEYAAAVAERDASSMIESNRNFHLAIAEAGRNAYFTSLFARLLDEGRRLLRLYYQSFDDRLPRQYVEEHRQMVAAIEAHDPASADRIASEHARQIVDQIKSYISRQPDPGVPSPEPSGTDVEEHGKALLST